MSREPRRGRMLGWEPWTRVGYTKTKLNPYFDAQPRYPHEDIPKRKDILKLFPKAVVQQNQVQ
jgi:hypothetical protein